MQYLLQIFFINQVFKYSEGFAIAMDYLDIRPLQLKEEGLLGIQLAQLT